MALILPTTQPARYIVKSGDTILLDGITQIGEATGVNNDLVAVYGEGDDAFLAATLDDAGDYNPLPDIGAWCEGGQIYSYNGSFVICRQSHYRTIYPLDQTPALWSVYRAEAGVLEWVASEPVVVGTHRIYNNVEYVCLQSHTTQVDWTPPATAGVLWQVYQEEPPTPTIPAWSYPVAYQIGDRVTYNGRLYECRQAHTSIVTWTPPVTPALWLDLGVYP